MTESMLVTYTITVRIDEDEYDQAEKMLGGIFGELEIGDCLLGYREFSFAVPLVTEPLDIKATLEATKLTFASIEIAETKTTKWESEHWRESLAWMYKELEANREKS